MDRSKSFPIMDRSKSFPLMKRNILMFVRSVNFFENDSCESKDADFWKVLEILFW